MTDISREMVEARLNELRNAQLEALTAASTILGRIQECELLLAVLDKEEEEAETPPSPTLVEAPDANEED